MATEPIRPFDPNAGGYIDLATAQTWSKNFQAKNPRQNYGFYFGSWLLNQIMGTKGATGIRFYVGYDEKDNNKMQLFFAAVDAKGTPILPQQGVSSSTAEARNDERTGIGEHSFPCPICNNDPITGG